MAEYVNPYAAQLAQLRQQADALANTPPQTQMYSPEEQARRALELRRMQTLGNLGGISNDKAIMNISEPLLKRAMEAQKPKYTEHGAFDETTGTHTYFPSYLANRKSDHVNKRLATAEDASARSIDQWNRDRARAEDQKDNRRLIAALRAGQGGSDEKGSFSFTGTNSENGSPIFMHSKRGPMIQDAAGNMIPYVGRIGPKNTEMSATAQAGYLENRAGNTRIDTVLGDIKKNPDAVGPVAVLPPWISQRIPESVMAGGESGVGVRAGVSNLSSLKIHDRSGAAVTVGEMQRLKPFIPDLRWDSPAAIQTKLEGFRLEYNTILKEIEAGHPLSTVIAKARAGDATKPITGLPPGQGMPPGLTPQQAEFHRKYGVPN